jgi:hypothetical protein
MMTAELVRTRADSLPVLLYNVWRRRVKHLHLFFHFVLQGGVLHQVSPDLGLTMLLC